MTWEVISYVSTVGPGIAAVLALAYQIYQDAAAKRKETVAIQKVAKLQIISDMVANRFVLVEDGLARTDSEEAIREFNKALSRIPIDFISNKKILQQYKDIGNKFDTVKFYGLISSMLTDAGVDVPAEFDLTILENVPTRNSCKQ